MGGKGKEILKEKADRKLLISVTVQRSSQLQSLKMAKSP